MGVMGRPTRPLPVPGPWGIPGPYQVYAGTRLKTTYNSPLSKDTSGTQEKILEPD